MKVIYNDVEKVEQTGIIATVYPFPEMSEFSVAVYSGRYVDINGSAMMNPESSREFADAIKAAADIAEGKRR